MDRIKWVLVIIAVGLVLNVIVLYYFLFNLKDETLAYKKQISQTIEEKIRNQTLPTGAPEATQEASQQNQKTTADCPNICLSEIQSLKDQIARITPQIVNQPAKLPVASSNSYVKEYYVFIGTGKTTARDWTDISGLSVDIDTSKYSKIQTARFEGTLKNPSGVGQIFVRLYNKTDKHPVWYSEFSIQGPDPVSKQSDPITLGTGNKTYQVQMKSTLGAEATVESSKVKITIE